MRESPTVALKGKSQSQLLSGPRPNPRPEASPFAKTTHVRTLGAKDSLRFKNIGFATALDGLCANRSCNRQRRGSCDKPNATSSFEACST